MSDYDEFITTTISIETVVDCVRRGVIVNDFDDDAQEMRVSDDSSWETGSKYDETDVDAMIRAVDLGDALTILSQATDGDAAAHPTGLVLRKAVIDGPFDLTWLNLNFPLRFDGCVFTGRMTLDYATLVALLLDNCTFELEGQHLPAAINAKSATVQHELLLRGVRGLKQLFVVDSVIGDLSLDGDALGDFSSLGHRFRTVLDGTTVNRLFLGSSLVRPNGSPVVLPLGTPSSLTVGSLYAPDPKAAGDGPARVETIDPAALAHWIEAGSSGEPDKTPYTRQVWETFACALERDAMAHEATEIRILGRRFARSKMSPLAKGGDWILDHVVGYGLKNWKALFWWVGVLAITLVVAAVAGSRGALGVSPNAVSDPFEVLLYSLNVVLSPVGTSGPDDWFFGGASTSVALTLSVLKIFSIGLIALFVSGITGIINKK